MMVYLVSKLCHVVLQAVLVVGLLRHLNQDVKVTVLLSQDCHPLVLSQLHCKAQKSQHDFLPGKKQQQTVWCC